MCGHYLFSSNRHKKCNDIEFELKFTNNEIKELLHTIEIIKKEN